MYFEKKGRSNTGKTIELALEAAREKGIGHVVVASNTGETARLLAGKGLKVVCVTHVNGFVEKGQNELAPETRTELTAAGVEVLTTTHVLSGAERGISRSVGGMYPVEVMANTLRMLGAGSKVCVEVGVMALDAGLIPYGEPVIAIGGTGRGADTAVVITPSHASSILETWIHEIICKPY